MSKVFIVIVFSINFFEQTFLLQKLELSSILSIRFYLVQKRTTEWSLHLIGIYVLHKFHSSILYYITNSALIPIKIVK